MGCTNGKTSAPKPASKSVENTLLAGVASADKNKDVVVEASEPTVTQPLNVETSEAKVDANPSPEVDMPADTTQASAEAPIETENHAENGKGPADMPATVEPEIQVQSASSSASTSGEATAEMQEQCKADGSQNSEGCEGTAKSGTQGEPQGTATMAAHRHQDPEKVEHMPGHQDPEKVESATPASVSQQVEDAEKLEQQKAFSIGQRVFRKGEECTVVKVDMEVDPPSYVIRKSDGSEIGTEHHLLQATSETQSSTRRQRQMCC